MSVDSNLRSVLSKHLTDGEISDFENGDACLFVTDPKYAFFRVTNDGFQRADVVQEHNPDDGNNNTVMWIYHDVVPVTSAEVQDRLEDQDDIDAFPMAVGFGDLT